jgi:hypothetical protein
MADKVQTAVTKLFQFSSQIDRTKPVTFNDIGPVLGAIADALMELDERSKGQPAQK